jgi:putative transposase
MSKQRRGGLHDRWARLRFSVIGPLLASPPQRGELHAALEALASKTWIHPATEEPASFAVPTLERWYYAARRAGDDPVLALRKKVRSDAGEHRSLGSDVRAVLRAQYDAHRTWSCQLHADNLEVVCEENPELGTCPSYWTVRRYMKETGLFKQRRVPNANRAGAAAARDRLENYEVRSYEATHVDALWHTDFHDGSKPVVTRRGELKVPQLFGVLDDHSRVACHGQWYLNEDTESFLHGMSQGFQKRKLPRSLLTDNGGAMLAGETVQGMLDLGIVHTTTLAYSPYQNAKQEVFWAQVEGRLMAMLEGVPELTLDVLNEATQAWIEMEYNRELHSEIGTSPVTRMLTGPQAGRACPGSDELRRAFRLKDERTQRRSDGTLSIGGVRFEVPSQYRHMERLTVRYARWDLSTADIVDPRRNVVLATLYPLDKAKNADGRRRALERVSLPPLALPKPAGVAPLLGKLIREYRSTGLPPAYLPKHDEKSEEDL